MSTFVRARMPIQQTASIRREGLRFEHVIGFALAGFALVGRWTPARVSNNATTSTILSEPRLWMLFFSFLLFCVLLTHIGARGYRRPRISPVYSRSFHVWLVFWGYLMLSMTWSPSKILAEDKAYELLLILLFQVLVYSYGQLFRMKYLVMGFCVGCLMVTVPMAIMGIMSPSQIRTGGLLGGGPNVFGRLMLYLTICSFYLLIEKKNNLLMKMLFAGLSLLGGLLVVLSGSRGALLSQAASLMVFFTLLRASLSKRFFIVVMLGCAAMVFLETTEMGNHVVETFTERIIHTTIENRHLAGRDYLFEAAWEYGNERMIFGNGLNSFRDLQGIYPHNILLELYCETGLVGLSLFLFALMVSAYACLYRREFINPLMVSLWVGIFVASNFSGDLFDSRMVFILVPMLSNDYEFSHRVNLKGNLS